MEETIEDRAKECLDRYTMIMHRARSDYSFIEYPIDELVELLKYIVGK